MLLNAIDRMMPMLRFFRHGDGNFALFNGMSTTPNDLIATLLAYDDTHGTPMASMPHSGFQRLDAASTAIIMDTGASPPPNVSQEAHAGCLAFELSSGTSRIVINCGMPATGRDNWRAFARETPAHSALTFRDTSSCEFVALSAMKRLLQGALIVSGPVNVETYREAVQNGVVLTASHDGYLQRFGILHRRAHHAVRPTATASPARTSIEIAQAPARARRRRLRDPLSPASVGEGEPPERRARGDAGAAQPRRVDVRGPRRQGRPRGQRVPGRTGRPAPDRADRDPPERAAGAERAVELHPLEPAGRPRRTARRTAQREPELPL